MLVKHMHLTLALLSVILFIWRFILSFIGSSYLAKKWLKITPHIIDTFLLISAVLLMFIISQYPIQTPWLTEKLVLVVAYILMGFATLKWCRNKVSKVIAFTCCMGMLALIGKLAVSKQSYLLAMV